MKDDVWHALIVVITNAPNLHGYTVRSLYKVVQAAGEQVFSTVNCCIYIYNFFFVLVHSFF